MIVGTGEAGDAAEAVAQIRKHKPDLVLSDLHMPEGGGLKVAKECGEESHVVIVTVSEAERDLLDAIAAGAVGYLLKSSHPDELRAALWKAAGGERVFSPSLAALVLTEFRRHTYKEIGENSSSQPRPSRTMCPTS